MSYLKWRFFFIMWYSLNNENINNSTDKWLILCNWGLNRSELVIFYQT